MLNLLSNAIKFTEQGSVRIELELLSDDRLLIEVCDTGIGIPAVQQRRLFQPFVQADASVFRQFGGSGLGLAISKSLVEALGGDITFESEFGEGTIFKVRIPIGDHSDSPFENQLNHYDAPQREIIESCEPEHPPATPPRLPYRILLAEDGPDNQRLIKLILTKAGAEVEIAADGQEAILLALEHRCEISTSKPYDLILMDMQNAGPRWSTSNLASAC